MPLPGPARAAVVLVTVVAVSGLLVLVERAAGPDSIGFALAVVWLPMTGLGTISHAVPIRLPAWFHRLRPFEADGRIYERLGIRAVKALLRRGPVALFNTGLHLPRERTPAAVAELDRRMQVAEATHALLFVTTLGVVVHAAARGWWHGAAWTLVADLAVNAAPVMLQRYNRARLARTA